MYASLSFALSVRKQQSKIIRLFLKKNYTVEINDSLIEKNPWKHLGLHGSFIKFLLYLSKRKRPLRDSMLMYYYACLYCLF